jgi:D-alanyl-D-alanine carboxypeptidase
MIDAETGTVLFSKDADKPIPPASMAKLMTMEVVFNAIKSGRLKLDDTFVVSENAWRKGGAPSGTSTMFAKLKSSIRLEDLIQGVTVQAANDGCIVIAEGMSGSEDNFAAQMTERARQIGLKTSTFVNSTGLPADGQQTTVRELAELGRAHVARLSGFLSLLQPEGFYLEQDLAEEPQSAAGDGHRRRRPGGRLRARRRVSASSVRSATTARG